MERQHWQDWVIAVIGVALVGVALWPAVGVGPETAVWTVRGNEIAAGVVALALALAALTAFRPWEPALVAVVGLWTAASPWLLGYAGSGFHTGLAVVSGLALAVLGVWSMLAEPGASAP